MRAAPIAMVVWASLAAAQDRAAAPTPAYDILATLDPARRTITGRQLVRWVNSSGETCVELRLQLPWNAWNGRRSLWLRSVPPERRAGWADADFGGLRLLSVRDVAGGRELDWTFVAVDARAPEDRTVVRALLAEPLAPGAEHALQIDFVATAPRARDGHGWLPGDTFVGVGWFPRLGRLIQQAGPEGSSRSAWVCPPWTPTGGPVGDPAAFDVRLDVPVGFAVAASGGPAAATRSVGAIVHHRFEARDSLDFGWVAGPGLRAEPFPDSGPGPAATSAPRLVFPIDAPESGPRARSALQAIRGSVIAPLLPSVPRLWSLAIVPGLPRAVVAGDLAVVSGETAAIVDVAVATALGAAASPELVDGLAVLARVAEADGAGWPLAALGSSLAAFPTRLPNWGGPGDSHPGIAPGPAAWRGTVLPDAPLLAALADQRLASYARPRALPGLRLRADGSPPERRVAAALRLVEQAVGGDRLWAALRRYRDPLERTDWRDILEDELGVGPAELFRAAVEPGAVLDHGIVAVDRDPDGLGQSVVVARHGDLRVDVAVQFRFAPGDAAVTRIYPASEPRRRLRFELPRDRHGDLVEVRVGSGPPGIPLDADLRDNGWRAAADRRPALDRALRLLPMVQWRLLSVGFGG